MLLKMVCAKVSKPNNCKKPVAEDSVRSSRAFKRLSG